ncbi:MAG: FMN-binding protein [Gemmatimonadaceae bacterium]
MTHKKRTTNNLVALGAAGVVAVYAAGYVRTAAAAQRFSDESNDRRPVPERDAPSPQGIVTAGQTSDARMAEKFGNSASGSAALIAKPTVVAATNAPSAVSVKSERRTKNDANVEADKSSTNDEAVKNAMASAASKAMADTSKTAAAAAAPVTTPATTAATATVIPPATTPPVAATEIPAKPEKAPLPPGVKWHDGRFVGYGQSRHGDIEATIEVWEGKISYVAISQCLTQYSCSFIEKLPQQVFDRQGPNVDNVSGATQSSNAFYYAIMQALQKAK